MYKKCTKTLDFTQISERGIYVKEDTKNPYNLYILFNKNYYNKENEAKMLLWQEMWDKKIFTDKIFRSKKEKLS